MSDQQHPNPDADYDATWSITVNVTCLATTTEGLEFVRKERASYRAFRKSTTGGMFRWIEDMENAKYAALGWPVKELVIDLERVDVTDEQ